MAPALLLALALFAADPGEAAPAPATEAAASEAPYPTGAPADDYGLVAWCYGALSAHMALYERVMPEVARIEARWERTPGSSAEEMKSYEEQRIEGVRAIAQFRRAMEAAERASVRPIQTEGAAAIKKGAGIWAGAKAADDRRLAQEWMSWALPGRCVPTAEALEKRSALFGQALNANAKEAPAVVEPPAPPPTIDDLTAEIAGTDAAPVTAPSAIPEAPAEAPAEEAAPSLRGVQ